jgi:hypothetical protein
MIESLILKKNKQTNMDDLKEGKKPFITEVSLKKEISFMKLL